MNYTEKYGEWAFVVGASAGLGAAFAEECASRGFKVVICARRAEKLEEVKKSVEEKYKTEVRTFVLDISDDDAAEKAYENIKDLDIGMYIFNAAVEMTNPFITTKLDAHMNQIKGNAITPLRLTYYIGRDMAKKHRGSILLLSSMSSIVGTSQQSSYGACKAFEMSLAETLWYELGKYGVDAAGVLVGSVVTPAYEAQQKAQGTNMKAGASYDVKGLIKGLKLRPAVLMAKPHTCAEVAHYVVEHAGDGPRIWSHKQDEKANLAYWKMPRRDATLLLSRVTDAFFSSGNESQLTDDRNEFVEIRKM